MTEEKTSFTYMTYVRSTPEKVFEAITKPDITRQFWGHENVSDWKQRDGNRDQQRLAAGPLQHEILSENRQRH